MFLVLFRKTFVAYYSRGCFRFLLLCRVSGVLHGGVGLLLLRRVLFILLLFLPHLTRRRGTNLALRKIGIKCRSRRIPVVTKALSKPFWPLQRLSPSLSYNPLILKAMLCHGKNGLCLSSGWRWRWPNSLLFISNVLEWVGHGKEALVGGWKEAWVWVRLRVM